MGQDEVSRVRPYLAVHYRSSCGKRGRMNPDSPMYADESYRNDRGQIGSAITLSLPCKGCGDKVNWTRLERGFCPHCRACCSICDDWMAGEAETVGADGGRVHATCEATAVLDLMAEALQMPTGDNQ